MLRVGIYGARGKMGQEICVSALDNQKIQLSSLYEMKSNSDVGKNYFNLTLHSSLEKLLQDSDVVIDFTSLEGTMALLEANRGFKKPLVIGTTGLSETEITLIKEAANHYPIVFSPNYSIGINLLLSTLEQVGRVLSKEKGYDLEIVELHHRFKKDSPSGTALKLAEVAAKASGRDLKEDGVYGRDGNVGPRSIDEVGVFAVRAGDIIGEHSVMFCSLGERIEFHHKAHSRKPLADGAVEAALWLCNKKAGLYDMKNVLAL